VTDEKWWSRKMTPGGRLWFGIIFFSLGALQLTLAAQTGAPVVVFVSSIGELVVGVSYFVSLIVIKKRDSERGETALPDSTTTV
jgi:hypothetical protein